MQYLLLIYDDPRSPEAERGEENIRRHMAIARDAVAKGVYVAANALVEPSQATTVRVRDEKAIVTEGPFAETREMLGGYYLLDCEMLDDAIAFASSIPQARMGSIEIRPVFQIAGWDEAIGVKAEGSGL